MQAINSSAVVRALVSILGILFALLVLYLVLASKLTGSVSALIFAAGIIGCGVALVNPRAGLYLAAFEGVYLDFFKKVAVYYGEASMLTIIQVLLVTLMTLGCIYLGIFLRVAFKMIKIRRSDVLLFIACLLLMGFFFLTEPVSVIGRVQSALNGGFYFGLVPTIAILLRDIISVRRYLEFLFWCMIPFAGWAFYQYAFGFTNMEWFYAYTGLSPISSAHMLLQEHPRVFGLASGPSGFGAISFFPVLGIYLAITIRKRRILYIFGTLVIFGSIIVAEQRTPLVFSLISFTFFLLVMTPRGTLLAYASFIAIFFCGIAASDYLLANLMDYSAALRQTSGADLGSTDNTIGGWKARVLSVNTFSDRLMGWRRLKDPKSYSLLGRLEGYGMDAGEDLSTQFDDEEHSHDVVNLILIQTGVIGLIICVTVGGFFLSFVHKLHHQIPDRKLKVFATILTAIIIPNILLQMIAGLTLTTNPLNLVIWVLCGSVFAINRIAMTEPSPEAPGETSPDSLISQLAPPPNPSLAR